MLCSRFRLSPPHAPPSQESERRVTRRFASRLPKGRTRGAANLLRGHPVSDLDGGNGGLHFGGCEQGWATNTTNTHKPNIPPNRNMGGKRLLPRRAAGPRSRSDGAGCRGPRPLPIFPVATTRTDLGFTSLREKVVQRGKIGRGRLSRANVRPLHPQSLGWQTLTAHSTTNRPVAGRNTRGTGLERFRNTLAGCRRGVCQSTDQRPADPTPRHRRWRGVLGLGQRWRPHRHPVGDSQ